MKPLLLVVFVLSSPQLSFAGKIFSFEGQIDFSTHEFSVVLDLDHQSSVAAKAQRTSERDYRFSLDIEHLQTPLFDLLSKIESSVEVIPSVPEAGRSSADTALRGNVWSQYSLVNYKPVQELSGNFEIKDTRLYLTALSFGNLKCEGSIGLRPPYKLDLAMALDGVAMNDFLNFWMAGHALESSGAVSGEIKASGTLDYLVLKGNLESRQGFVQKLDYDTILLNIEGVYPHMNIAHSMISKSDGVSFIFDGPFDLKDMGNFKKQVRALTIAPLVDESGSAMEWTIKRLSPQGSDMTELKYRVHNGDALGTETPSGDQIDILGIERTRKF